MVDNLTIAIDAMGGDQAPGIVVDGISKVLESEAGIRFLVFGHKDKLEPLLEPLSYSKAFLEFVHTDSFVAMDAKPAQALRQRENTSLWAAIKSVKDEQAHAVVSAGNTGALMAMSRYCLGTLPGITRPAISAIWPTVSGPSIVLDVGANIDTSAQQLVEFAIMGSACARVLFGKDQPTVGLLNVGSEDVKGHDDVREASAILKENKLGLNFIGFIEGNGIAFGAADVVVTDGFTGNIALKTAEGMAKMLAQELRSSLSLNLMTKLGAMLSMSGLNNFKKKVDPNESNGAPLLGLNGLVIKSHGGTDGAGYANAISTASRLAQNDFTNRVINSVRNLNERMPASSESTDSDAAETNGSTPQQQSLAVSS